MKVVLFCGGFGMRLRDFSESIPKPMVPIGNRPILWHVMKYYAHHGHTDFILCLGWQADVIKNYFLTYNECVSNDFVLAPGGKIDLLSSDIQDWNINFIDTGHMSSIGERLKAVEPLLAGEEEFLANYADGLCDLRLPDLIDFHRSQAAVASFLSVRPSQTFHVATADQAGRVDSFVDVRETDTWMNGGYFVFHSAFFDYLHSGEDLVEEPFKRLMADDKLFTLKHDGFWSCMDTYKEKQSLDAMYHRGDMPWMMWANKNEPNSFQRKSSSSVHPS